MATNTAGATPATAVGTSPPESLRPPRFQPGCGLPWHPVRGKQDAIHGFHQPGVAERTLHTTLGRGRSPPCQSVSGPRCQADSQPSVCKKNGAAGLSKAQVSPTPPQPWPCTPLQGFNHQAVSSPPGVRRTSGSPCLDASTRRGAGRFTSG